MTQDDAKKIQDLKERVSALSRIILKAQQYATTDPEVSLTQARKSAEAICRLIFAREIGEPGKIMLDELIKKLIEKKLLPGKVVIPFGTIQAYGNYGTHAQADTDELDADYVLPCLQALATVSSWFWTEYLGTVMPPELEAGKIPPDSPPLQASFPAAPALVSCPLCGKKNRPEDTFGCRSCGKDDLCMRHQDGQHFVCMDCANRKRETSGDVQRSTDGTSRRSGTSGQPGTAVPSEVAEYRNTQGLVHRGRNEQGLEEYQGEKSGVILVRIPGGEFRMGSDRGSDAKPVHRVAVGDYLVGKYPVTVGEYGAFCAATRRSMPYAPQWGWDKSNPMVNVSWDDAVAYCRWAGGRLPTEAEWEYAAGGGAKHQVWAGTDDEGELEYYAWYSKNSGGRTRQVGKKRPSLFGLHDMSGNVLEWCADWYDGDYYANSPVDNPLGPSTGSYRVLRGGSWLNGAGRARSAYRNRDDPGNRYVSLGFRLALSP